MPPTCDLPLAGIHVIDAVSGPLAPISRYLAELGARVDRFAPNEVRDNAVALAANIGKIHHDAGLDSPAARPWLEAAHIVIADAAHTIDLAAWRARRPDLVTMAVSDFGTGNRFSGWRGSGPVFHALSGELARSGIRGREPVLPPGDLAYQCAAAQAAFALLAALYRALSGGGGAHFDFAGLDGAVQALDPGFGISGSATLGKPAGLLSRDRPREGFQYPIFRCADGYVRICLLAKRQWRGMFAWLGEPAAFASPEFDKTAFRYKSPTLLPAIARFFADQPRADLERQGQHRGVPISAVQTLEEFMASPQVAFRDALHILPDGARLPNGVLTVDGARMGPRPASDAPRPASDAPQAWPAPASASAWPAPAERGSALPFAGLKVLDLGVIVVGAEQGRLLADFGADVVKVESLGSPDGNRQSYLAHGMSVSFAAGHRNKRSLGIDLKSPDGRALFLDLVREADVLCSNFKPGTMDKLGLGHAALAAVNPALIISESSAFGGTGPWSGRMGYGPLVRAATGLTLAWRYPGDAEGFCNSITVYPDHVAGRVCAIGAAALLIRRLRSGTGGASAVAQSEVMLGQCGDQVLRLSRGEAAVPAVVAPSGVYRAAGDDEWCVIDLAGEADRAALARAIGFVAASAEPAGASAEPAGGLADLAAAVAAWVAARPPMAAAEALQVAGIAAAPMLRLGELPGFAYYRERGFYRVESHPWLQEEVIADAYVAHTGDIPPPPQRPAPLVGEQTEAIVADWLALGAEEIARLSQAGILEPLHPETHHAAQAFMATQA